MYSWKSYFVVQADYQSWANNVLFDALGRLKPEALERDEGLFFRSIHHSVNHMLVTSQLWLARLKGHDPQVGIQEAQRPAWRELQAAMRRETRALQEWLEAQPDAFFDDQIRFRDGDGTPRTMWVREALSHLFSHYVHHRGQIALVAARLGAPWPEMEYAQYRWAMERLLQEASQSPR